jgi:transglutaminase-like putative cysteine protease
LESGWDKVPSKVISGPIYKLIYTLFIVCLTPLILPGCGPSPDTDEAAYTRPLQIRYGFTLTNTTNQLVKKVRLRAFVPLRQTATQKRTRLTTSHPFEELGEGPNNQALLFKLGDMAPYSSRVVTVRAQLLLADTPVPTKPDNQNLFLSAENHIEADHPRIVRLAQTLKQSKAPATARQVHDWVAGNLKYTGYRKNPRGALYALTHRQGDCTEFMHLFVALCRANGIPARGRGGYICEKNSVLKPAGYHNWAEFYDGRSWLLADPQNRVFMQDPATYIAMRSVGVAAGTHSQKFHQYQVAGDGVIVKMNK